VLADLRKLYLSIFLPRADITMGRQIINFGKGVVFSPLDVFSTVELTDLQLERRGSDVVMAVIPFGMLSGIDVVAGLPGMDGSYATAAKAYATLADFDLSGVAMYRDRTIGEDEVVVGGAFKGDVLVGLYGELVGHLLGTPGQWDEQYYIDAMIGADYSFGKELILAAEFSHSGAERAQRVRTGKYNGYASARYLFNDLMSVSGSVIHQYYTSDVALTIATAQYSYNILQNVNTVAYVQWIRSDLFEDVPTLSVPDLQYALRAEVVF
jgi:hypothetical protein